MSPAVNLLRAQRRLSAFNMFGVTWRCDAYQDGDGA